MSEEVARAVGANGAETITIAGKECTVRALSLKELAEVERECLKLYRRSYLDGFADNRDLLPETVWNEFILKKMDEVSKWDVTNLPKKVVYDQSRLKWAKELQTFLFDLYDVAIEEKEDRLIKMQVLNLAATALDSEELSEKQYVQWTGHKPKKAQIGYVNWWITGCFEGMITMIWVAFRHNGVTKDEVSLELGKNQNLMVQLSREIEKLSSPQVGN